MPWRAWVHSDYQPDACLDCGVQDPSRETKEDFVPVPRSYGNKKSSNSIVKEMRRHRWSICLSSARTRRGYLLCKQFDRLVLIPCKQEALSR